MEQESGGPVSLKLNVGDKALGRRRLVKVGKASYALILPVQWVRWFLEPAPDGDYYVTLDVSDSAITVRPVKQ